ncbi:acyl carrier protein [Haloferula rosea]|uniref:Acyl carrier protein n=1 Tax=Haloferula rosea TaxID=490093 RepID=A0A934VF97_9BACT|nr:acyl carrier protein [Haloferula rosea]MBK1828139.1 acyl carrier protein [Haloferula rosea]
MSEGCRTDEVVEMLRQEALFELPHDFGAGSDLFELGMDSMAVMQLIVIIEERWGVALGAEDASRENLGTPEKLAATIQARQ